MQDIYDYEYSTLPSNLRDELIEEGNKVLVDNPVLQAFLLEMYNKGVKIKSEIPRLMNNISSFDKFSNTISFRSESDMRNHRNILEELLHAMQYNCYGNSYMGNSRRKNVEFEVRVIMDALALMRNDPHSISELYGVGGNQPYDYAVSYNQWLIVITLLSPSGGGDFPSFNEWALTWDDEGKYGRWSDTFIPQFLFDVLDEWNKMR